MSVKAVLDYFHKGHQIEQGHLVELLQAEDPECQELLRKEADQVRREHVGDVVYFRGIIEFSNYCPRSCQYCGISRLNRKVKRYRIPPQVILDTAFWGARAGCGTMVLQSGEDHYYSVGLIADIIREIKKMGVAVTLSLGERQESDYRTWREAGADRYLLKLETSDPDLYARLHPGSSLADRLQALNILKALGYQVGSGFIWGLPGQSLEMIADDLLVLRSLEVDMAGTGPFIPHPGTPLANHPPGDVGLSLRALAVTRLILPQANLPATTALASLDHDGRRLGLTWGANVLMPNLTPTEYRRFYEIYPDKAEVADTPENLCRQSQDLVTSLGRLLEGANDGITIKLRDKHA